jgi:uncharacterized Zn finger protein
MSYWGWKPYVSVAERQKKAEKAVAKAKKAGVNMSPITAYRGALAKTFWGKAWGDNLEHYSDYENRLPRGRTYVRNGSVIDLQISAGEVRAQVMGSELYTVEVSVAAVPAKQWKAIGADCSGSIDSLVELLQGKLSTAVMARICQPGSGLFPAPKDIQFSCSCPDWASMCKHVAAVLYGVGTRLDEQPELLFTLRRVDAKDLVMQAGAGLPKTRKATKASKVLDDSALGDVFGIEMAEAVPAKPKPRSKAVVKKSTPAKAVTSKAKVPAKKTAQETSKTASKERAKKLAKAPAKVSAKAPPRASASVRTSGDKSPAKPRAKPASVIAKPVKPKAVVKRTK